MEKRGKPHKKMKKILIATARKGKLDEFKGILKGLNFKFLTLKDLNHSFPEPEETGKTFAENAIIKVKFYAEKSGLLTLADDSGLVVPALAGKLGIKTKRYAKGSDQNRLQKLLKEMAGFPANKRKAKFISFVAFFNPKDGKLKITQGVCQGKIAHKPKGKYGFGYDPIFVVDGLNKRFAELTLTEKNQVSHRALALQKMKKFLKQYEN